MKQLGCRNLLLKRSVGNPLRSLARLALFIVVFAFLPGSSVAQTCSQQVGTVAPDANFNALFTQKGPGDGRRQYLLATTAGRHFTRDRNGALNVDTENASGGVKVEVKTEATRGELLRTA